MNGKQAEGQGGETGRSQPGGQDGEMGRSQDGKQGAGLDGKHGRIITVPNILSFFRICLLPVLVWLYCVERNDLWTVLVLLLSGATDLADGFIARKFHMVSDLGKVLDPVADKLTQGVMLACLIVRFPLMAVPFSLMLAKEIFMGITGLMIIRRTGEAFGARWHGKAATCLLYLTAILHVAWPGIPAAASGISIAACTLMIAVSLIFYAVSNIKVLNRKN